MQHRHVIETVGTLSGIFVTLTSLLVDTLWSWVRTFSNFFLSLFKDQELRL